MEELLDRSPLATEDRRSEIEYPRGNEDKGFGTADEPIPTQISRPDLGHDGPSEPRVPTVIQFAPEIFGIKGASREFLTDAEKPFNWASKGGTSIEKVVWQAYDDILGQGHSEELAVATSVNSESNDEFDGGPLMKVKKTGALLNLPQLNQAEMITYLNRTMKIMVEWKKDGKPGFTLSGIFAVINMEKDKGLWFQKIAANYNETGPLAIGQEFDGLHQTFIQTATRPLSTAMPTTTTAAPTLVDASGKPTEPASVGGNSGLSTGAIAGIAVGGAVFLIILITIIFCLYRRRHRKRQAEEQSGYDSQQGATVYFADKAANRGPDTPQTPYSEDGNRMPMDDLPMSSVATVNQQQPHDHIRQEQQQHHLRTASDSAWPLKNTEPLPVRSGTATPLGVSSNIVHLVEDGMTDDEIRRLEEEERHIEAAIAARRR